MNKYTKLISIVIATLNSEKTIEITLKSIVNQLNDDIELILVDGGSEDGTINIINKYISYISIFITEKDNGIYDAWNKGIKYSKGKWIMFIGSDDLLIEGTIKHYLNLLSIKNLSNYDIISGKSRYVTENGNLIKIIGGKFYWKSFKRKMTIAHVGALHNIKLFQEVGFFNDKFKICGDYELLLRERSNLKHYFTDYIVSEMKIGGISFSKKAIIEAYKVKRLYSDESMIIQLIDLFIAYVLYLRRKIIISLVK